MPTIVQQKPTSNGQKVVAQQAEDDGLWFIAETAAEAYVQQELRKLHAVIEGAAIDETRPKPPRRLDDELPTTRSLTRSDPDFTGGLSTDEFMRKIRGQ